jgi:hypothetical protein
MHSVLDRLENTNDATRKAQWPGVARAFYKWDAQIQEQSLLWRDLIRGERLPLDLAPLISGDAWKKVRVYRTAVETLKAPLIVGGVFTALLVTGGALLASGANYAGLTAALSILGALGLTSAGLYARAKAEMTSLVASLRLAVDQQRVKEAPTCVQGSVLQPPPRSPSNESRQADPSCACW